MVLTGVTEEPFTRQVDAAVEAAEEFGLRQLPEIRRRIELTVGEFVNAAISEGKIYRRYAPCDAARRVSERYDVKVEIPSSR